LSKIQMDFYQTFKNKSDRLKGSGEDDLFRL
jgi:hypothetical protein